MYNNDLVLKEMKRIMSIMKRTKDPDKLIAWGFALNELLLNLNNGKYKDNYKYDETLPF